MLFIRTSENGSLIETVVDGIFLSEAANKADVGDKAHPIWCDLIDPTPAERAYVDRIANVAIPSRAEMEEIEVSSRLYNEDGVEYMTVTAGARLDTAQPIKTPVVFILGRSVLVTVRYADIKPFNNVLERLKRPGGCQASMSGENLMLSLVEAMVDRLADGLEWIGDALDATSRDVFRSNSTSNAVKRGNDLQAIIENVGRQGELLGLVRESLVSFNRLLGYHLGMYRNDKGVVDSDGRVRTIQRDVASLSDHASYLGTKVNFLLDATLGLINVEQNQIIKIFSIAAVCLMPPTLVASIYGMNFKSIPELNFEWGYPMALCMMIVTGVAPVIYFKRKGWL